MPTPKPTDLPEWASEDQKSDISGQYNVVKPPDERELSGWLFGEKPNRQWWNWLHRQTYLWLKYFNDNLDFDADNFTPVWTGLNPAAITQNYGYYSKEGDRVYFTIHTIWAAQAVNTGLSITNMPFPAKNSPGFIQSVHISRGVGPTLPDGRVISAIIGANSTTLVIWGEDTATGLGTQEATVGPANIGQLIISGFYFIEETP